MRMDERMAGEGGGVVRRRAMMRKEVLRLKDGVHSISRRYLPFLVLFLPYLKAIALLPPIDL